MQLIKGLSFNIKQKVWKKRWKGYFVILTFMPMREFSISIIPSLHPQVILIPIMQCKYKLYSSRNAKNEAAKMVNPDIWCTNTVYISSEEKQYNLLIDHASIE